MITSLILLTALNPLKFNTNNAVCMSYEIRHTQTILVDDNYNSIEANFRFSYNLYNGYYNSSTDFVHSYEDNGEGFITNGILFCKLARVDVDYYYNNAQGVTGGKKTTKLASVRLTETTEEGQPAMYWITNGTYTTTNAYTNEAPSLRAKVEYVVRPISNNVAIQLKTTISAYERPASGSGNYVPIYQGQTAGVNTSQGLGDVGDVYTGGVYNLTPSITEKHAKMIDQAVKNQATALSQYRNILMEDIGTTLDAKYNLGYQAGIKAAQLSNDISSPFELLSTAFSGVADILAIKIGPVSLGLLLSLPLVALVVGAVIKIIGG